jgi:hypothetical protein
VFKKHYDFYVLSGFGRHSKESLFFRSNKEAEVWLNNHGYKLSHRNSTGAIYYDKFNNKYTLNGLYFESVFELPWMNFLASITFGKQKG